MIKKECKYCHKTYYGISTQNFCCNECRNTWWKEERRVKERKHRQKGTGKLKKYCTSVQELRDKGLSNKEIAKTLGLKEVSIRSICKTYNLGERKIKYRTPVNPIEKVKKELLNVGFIYISGYKNVDSKVIVKCLKCGNSFQYKYHSLISYKGLTMRGNPVCRNCGDHSGDIQKLLDKQAERLNKQLKEQDKQLNAFNKWLKGNILYINRCESCGKEIISRKHNRRYCSKECANKSHYREKDKTRYERIVSNKYDDDITLLKVFNRNNGVCYLCGNKCDYNDYVYKKGKDGRNAFVVGGDYPSIEHIVPLSKGGTHTWDNILLAHKHCNELKGAKTLPTN